MSTTPQYDESLLKGVGPLTKSQRQEGYDPNLLRAKEIATEPVAPLHAHDPEVGNKATATSLPFWRTRKGMLIIAGVALVVIAAVVGGAVGGKDHKKNLGNNIAGNATSTTTPSPSLSAAPVASVGSGLQGLGGGSLSAQPSASLPHH